MDKSSENDGIDALERLLTRVRGCRLCAEVLPLPPRPVLQMQRSARLLIIGQAPSHRVHDSVIPWNDASGQRLRQWLDVSDAVFYDPTRVAIMAMALCYPGRDPRGGDRPPPRGCAPRWHAPLRAELPAVRLTLLVGRHAQAHYLRTTGEPLGKAVADWRRHLRQGWFPLPHPSPRNTLWLRRRPWFEAEVLPALRMAVGRALEGRSRLP